MSRALASKMMLHDLDMIAYFCFQYFGKQGNQAWTVKKVGSKRLDVLNAA